MAENHSSHRGLLFFSSCGLPLTVRSCKPRTATRTLRTAGELRKKKRWSQGELAERTNVSRVMIGKYERSEAMPSIEAAKSIADAFEVSLDYLVGEGVNASFDKRTVKRLQDIQSLDPDTQNMLFRLIDTMIRDAKAKKAYA